MGTLTAPPGPAVIRKARLEDASAVAALLSTLGYPSPADRVEQRIADCAGSADTAVFVAESMERVVGVISFHRIPMFHADEALGRITSLVVAPECRQQGVGRLLVACVEEFARTHGCARIEVTSGDHREDAHAFYERLGYEVNCRRFIKRNS